MIWLHLSKIIAFLLDKCMNPQLMVLKFNFYILFFLYNVFKKLIAICKNCYSEFQVLFANK